MYLARSTADPLDRCPRCCDTGVHYVVNSDTLIRSKLRRRTKRYGRLSKHAYGWNGCGRPVGYGPTSRGSGPTGGTASGTFSSILSGGFANGCSPLHTSCSRSASEISLTDVTIPARIVETMFPLAPGRTSERIAPSVTVAVRFAPWISFESSVAGLAGSIGATVVPPD